MSDDWLVSSFERFGEPKLLPTRAAAEAAIARQQIDHATQVTVRMPSGDRQTLAAGDIPQFRELLGDPPAGTDDEGEVLPAGSGEPPGPEPVPDAVPPPSAPVAAPTVPPGPAPAPAPPTSGTPRPSALDRAAREAQQTLGESQRTLLYVLAAALALGGYFLIAANWGGGGEPAAGASEQAIATVPAGQDAAQDVVADAASEASQAASEAPTQDSSQAAEASCQARRDPLDRLICEEPTLRSADNRLRNSWNAARRRLAGSSQRVEPLSSVRQRVASCRTAACAQQAYAFEAQRLDQLQPAAQAPAMPAPVIAAAPRCAPSPATPRGNPGGWISSNDYPSSAMRAGLSGTVAFQVTVGVDGRVAGCQITGSSGHSELDAATCRTITRRARFTPATGADCQPAAGSYSSRVRWTLPE